MNNIEKEKIINDRIDLIIKNGANYRSIESSPFYKLNSLNLEEDFLKNIERKIKAKLNFKIEVFQMKKIALELDLKIGELLKHPNFDPLKESLREKYKSQFESFPFEIKGDKYYLYPKGYDFPIDNEISSLIGYKKILLRHIERNTPIRYNYSDK